MQNPDDCLYYLSGLIEVIITGSKEGHYLSFLCQSEHPYRFKMADDERMTVRQNFLTVVVMNDSTELDKGRFC